MLLLLFHAFFNVRFTEFFSVAFPLFTYVLGVFFLSPENVSWQINFFNISIAPRYSCDYGILQGRHDQG